MSKSKSKLVPHELRPANTAQSTIEQNRLSSELKKLDRDKKISISQLSASQAVLQKSLRAMVTGGQQSAQDMTGTAQTGPSPAPSVLNPNFGSRSRLMETPRSISRVNVIMADPDVLATTSTKSFHGQIIGGQAQHTRKMESNRNVRMSHSSVGSSATQVSRSSMGFIMDGSLYNVPEQGAVTGVQFTEEDVEQGVRDSVQELAQAAPSEPLPPAPSVPEPSEVSDVILPALDEEEASQPAEDVSPTAATGGETESRVASGSVKQEELQLVVPEMPAAMRSEAESPEMVIPVQSHEDRSTSRPNTSSARVRALGRTSRTSRTSTYAPSTAPSPPVLPATISQLAYTRAVERAFANKCLKHSKFVTDLEMHEFVTKYLLIEQQNENFKRANEFACQIIDAQMGL